MDNDLLLAVIIALALALLVTTAFMEWIGVMNLFTPRSGPRYDGCGHFKLILSSQLDRCWHCRHERLEHLLHVPAQHPRHRAH